MDIAELLQSPSISDQCAAAVLLRSQGAEGAVHLQPLLTACLAVEPIRKLDSHQEALLSYSSSTICQILGDRGFDADNPLHADLVGLVICLTNSSNLQVAASAICALGLLKKPSDSTVRCLKDLVVSSIRKGEHPDVQMRAMALRSLWELDAPMAEQLIASRNIKHYERALKHAIKNGQRGDAKLLAQLRMELDWLNAIRQNQLVAAEGETGSYRARIMYVVEYLVCFISPLLILPLFVIIWPFRTWHRHLVAKKMAVGTCPHCCASLKSITRRDIRTMIFCMVNGPTPGRVRGDSVPAYTIECRSCKNRVYFDRLVRQSGNDFFKLPTSKGVADSSQGVENPRLEKQEKSAGESGIS